MKAITYQGREDVRYASVPDPVIETAGDAIVKVRLAGICGSDLHVYHDREKGLDPGTVMGHEFVGEVVEVASGVSGLRKGEMVFSPFTTSCGQCFYCRLNLSCRCTAGQLFGWVEQGSGLQGAQAEYVRVPLADTTLLRLPEGISTEEALLLGDVLSTGFFCAESAGVSASAVHAVVGCGPVGLMAIYALRRLGGAKIYAIDAVPERLALAERFGATPLDYRVCDPITVLKDATEGRGADAVLEVVGSPAAARLAFELVRPGGVIAAAGVHTESHLAFSPQEAYGKNLTYRTGRCPARAYMERLVPVVQERECDLASIISHRFPLEQGRHGYQIFDRKLEGCTKVVLIP